MFDYMPVQASSWAANVDWINNFITNGSVLCTVLICGTMLYFAVKYRRRSPEQSTPYITHNASLETVWTLIPTIGVIYIFYFGFSTYREMRTPPANALEIMVDAYSWRWDFQYPNGKKTTNELYVPVGRPVRFVMTSHDVLHSFFVPAMRVKEDVRGGVYSYLWFTPIMTGTFPIFCAEYCGTQHSAMRATLHVVSEEEYLDYTLDRGPEPELPPQELGKKIFTNKACTACHSIDGTTVVGPSLKGLFSGSKDRQFEDGTTGVIDENYVQESILYPDTKIVKGFADKKMSSFKDQLTETELKNLIAYLKTL